MKRRTWRVAAVVAVLGVAATLLALSAGRGRVAARSVRDADSHVVGVGRLADDAVRVRVAAGLRIFPRAAHGEREHGRGGAEDREHERGPQRVLSHWSSLRSR